MVLPGGRSVKGLWIALAALMLFGWLVFVFYGNCGLRGTQNGACTVQRCRVSQGCRSINPPPAFWGCLTKPAPLAAYTVSAA